MTKPRNPGRLPPKKSFLARTWLLWVVVLLAVGGGGAYYYYNYATIASAEIAYVKRGTAVTSVYGTVDVKPTEEAILRTRNPGTLGTWKVKVGDAVKKDEPLVQLSDDSLQRELDSAQQNLSKAKMTQSLGPPSMGDLKNQEINVDKTQKLVDAGNLADVELQKEKVVLAQLRDKVQNEQLTLDNDVDTLQRLVDGFVSQMKLNQIISPIDGVVLNIYANSGDYLPPQTQLCRIGSAANQIVASVNEEDIGYLKPGMKAQISLYAYPDKKLTGTLLNVGTTATNQAYPVTFNLDDPTQNLLPGMTGEMNVVIGEHENVLTIPTRAIRHGFVILTVVNGVVQEAHCHIGFKTLETSEVLDGMDEGTAVILSNQDMYKPGMRVRTLVTKDN
jgi:HlyD family secretion protein